MNFTKPDLLQVTDEEYAYIEILYNFCQDNKFFPATQFEWELVQVALQGQLLLNTRINPETYNNELPNQSDFHENSGYVKSMPLDMQKDYKKQAPQMFKAFLSETNFEQLFQYPDMMSAIFTGLTYSLIDKASIEKSPTGRQHVRPDKLTTKYIRQQKQVDVFDLAKSVKFVADVDYIVCYEEHVYSDALEKFFSYIEAGLGFLPKKDDDIGDFKIDNDLSALNRYMLGLTLSLLLQRSESLSTIFYKVSDVPKPDIEDADLHLAQKALATAWEICYERKILVLESKKPIFPFHLGMPVISGSEQRGDTLYINEEKMMLSFTLSPTLKVIILPAASEDLPQDIQSILRAKAYKDKSQTHVTVINSSDVNFLMLSKFLSHVTLNL